MIEQVRTRCVRAPASSMNTGGKPADVGSTFVLFRAGFLDTRHIAISHPCALVLRSTFCAYRLPTCTELVPTVCLDVVSGRAGQIAVGRVRPRRGCGSIRGTTAGLMGDGDKHRVVAAFGEPVDSHAPPRRARHVRSGCISGEMPRISRSPITFTSARYGYDSKAGWG